SCAYSTRLRRASSEFRVPAAAVHDRSRAVRAAARQMGGSPQAGFPAALRSSLTQRAGARKRWVAARGRTAKRPRPRARSAALTLTQRPVVSKNGRQVVVQALVLLAHTRPVCVAERSSAVPDARSLHERIGRCAWTHPGERRPPELLLGGRAG